MSLDNKLDADLIKEIKDKGCNECYQIICRRHENLFYKISQKYIPIIESVVNLSREEVLEDKHLVIFKALSSYKSDKDTKFSTWLGNCTKYHCLNLLNSNTKRMINCDEDFIRDKIDKKALLEHSPENEGKNNFEFVFNILNQLKDERIAMVFRLRYFGDFGKGNKPTWSRIAKEINTSTQTAINLHRRGKRILKKKLTCNNYADVV
jgi:RNA polymerase sigma factor (sigma-70 family)